MRKTFFNLHLDSGSKRKTPEFIFNVRARAANIKIEINIDANLLIKGIIVIKIVFPSKTLFLLNSGNDNVQNCEHAISIYVIAVYVSKKYLRGTVTIDVIFIDAQKNLKT
jgi:hypothetical protein